MFYTQDATPLPNNVKVCDGNYIKTSKSPNDNIIVSSMQFLFVNVQIRSIIFRKLFVQLHNNFSCNSEQ